MSILISERRSAVAEASLEAHVQAKALEVGFDEARIASAGDIAGLDAKLRTFLAQGHHGSMHWLEANADRRANPKVLWPQAESIVVVTANYGPAGDPMAGSQSKDSGVVSVYAGGEDYHDVLKKRLKTLARWFAAKTGEDVKVFVDTAPVMEKPIAERAGIGWQGKHTNLVSRRFGSWLFLGSMFTTARLRPDPPERDHCGSCRACLDVCPTNAFPAPYQLDARRCISYLTIEHKGPIDRSLRAAIGNRIYGCDDCLAVCPWNKYARVSQEARFKASPGTDQPPLAELAELDDAAFRTLYRKSPIKRTGRDRFVRNVLIAIGNSSDPDLVPAAKARLGDPSPLVRGMAVWALSRLLDIETFAALRDCHAPTETDEDVQAEWAAA